jgi:hypothetical protein
MNERPIKIFDGTSKFSPDPKKEKVVKPPQPLKRTSIKKKTDNALGVLKDVADRLFSVWIKKRDNVNGFFTCVTCPKVLPIKLAENGHYCKRGENAVRFDERNCAAQCNECNCYKDGRPFEFAKAIDKKHGTGTAAELKALSKAPFKLQRTDLELIIDKYKPKTK